MIEPSKAWLVQLSRDLAKVKMAPLGALVQCASTPIMKYIIDIKNVHRKQSCIITELLCQISFNLILIRIVLCILTNSKHFFINFAI